MRTFTRMATAAIDTLTPEERVQVNPAVFARIVSICADIADGVNPNDGTVALPAMHYVKAYLLVPGDYVWAATLSFKVVTAVEVGDDDVSIEYNDLTVTCPANEPVKVAVSKYSAQQWNDRRSEMADPELEHLYATYGSW